MEQTSKLENFGIGAVKTSGPSFVPLLVRRKSNSTGEGNFAALIWRTPSASGFSANRFNIWHAAAFAAADEGIATQDQFTLWLNEQLQ